MMSKDYLKILISKSKNFAKEHGIFDIVLFGSSVKGKIQPEDVDVALLFIDKNAEERRDIGYNFKKLFKGNINNLHVESVNFKDFFDASFFARQGILIEGYSLIHGSKLSERLGFDSFSLFNYSLKNLNHSKKTSFTYSLIGRKGKEGIINIIKARHLGKGVVIVPIEESLVFEEFLNKWEINYKKKNILASRL